MDIPKYELEKIQKYQIKLRPNILIAKKLYHPNRKIKSEVSDFFQSPDKYFDANSPVSINKRISLKKNISFRKN